MQRGINGIPKTLGIVKIVITIFTIPRVFGCLTVEFYFEQLISFSLVYLHYTFVAIQVCMYMVVIFKLVTLPLG